MPGERGTILCRKPCAASLRARRRVVERSAKGSVELGLDLVQPGGERGSIAALDPLTGETLWATGNAPPGHSSLIAYHGGGQTQVIGYDKTTLGGWDVETGKRL